MGSDNLHHKNRRILILIPVVSIILITIFFHINQRESSPPFSRPAGDHLSLSKEERNLYPTIPILHQEEEIDVNAIQEKWNTKTLTASEWGEKIPKVRNRMNTDQKVIALTFDACGGPYGSGYDEKLISFLREEQIPATLFINARWIHENEEIFIDLSKDELFSIENHGTEHLPLSIHGKTAWGISGTTSVNEVINEVMDNQYLIFEITGRYPSFFRSGTAFYDDISVQIVEDLGMKAVNYDILGDAGATFSAEQVKNALIHSNPGSIALLHMNQPSSGTAQGVIDAIPLLKERGFKFVHLTDYELIE
ncbi:polysaccharide deacetylase family protein [Evansella tamaricis]|uniref:Polysaccharide deacetylase family protein n=1 Tax=Evansella tamaricis TaxID=2069301 RepID=A0ABS6JJB1_9BACI|nr:polysaccharide deacetylase family protein [Evansella tamaricis]MBU9713779.1 polysaccharide deacetylase family protein [Evansella tamaricis]